MTNQLEEFGLELMMTKSASLDIALLPRFQNQGVGTKLLRLLIEEATRANKRLATHGPTCALTTAPHRFYERLGFLVIEVSRAYKHMGVSLVLRACDQPQ